MSMGYAIALSCIVLVIGLIACVAVLAWFEDMDINSTRCYGQNTYMVRIVTADSKPIRAVQADYPGTFTFRDILWQQHAADGKRFRPDADAYQNIGFTCWHGIVLM